MTTPLERLRAIAAGDGYVAPVHAAFGTVLDAVEPGRVSARIPVLPPHRLRGPGVVPVLGDLVLSGAITSTLPAGLRISTVTLHITLVGPLPPPGEVLVAAAELLDCSGGSAVSRADVRALDGRPVGHLTTRCAVLAVDAEPPLFQADRDLDPLSVLVPDLVAAPALANSGGAVQGGVLAAVLGDRIGTAAGAVATDLDVTFLRPVPADGAAMTADVDLVHAGRRLVAGRGALHAGGGRLAVVANAACWRGHPDGQLGPVAVGTATTLR